jgi:hypothetical protein
VVSIEPSDEYLWSAFFVIFNGHNHERCINYLSASPQFLNKSRIIGLAESFKCWTKALRYSRHSYRKEKSVKTVMCKLHQWCLRRYSTSEQNEERSVEVRYLILASRFVKKCPISSGTF